LRDLPQQKTPGSYAVGEILLYFYVPMFPWKDVLMGQIMKTKKTQRGKGQIRRIQKKKPERMEERKRRDLIFFGCGGSQTRVFSIQLGTSWRFPYSYVLHSVRNAIELSSYCPCVTLPQENPTTLMGTSPTTFIKTPIN
jgi:hypothetical protein